MDSSHFRINAPQVISECIDGETIIINLETGHYFSLNRSAGVVWEAIGSGLSVDRIIEAIGHRFDGASSDIEAALLEFLANLQKDGLIAPLEGNSSATPSGFSVESDSPRLPFEKPLLQKYSDMEDLLLLDPIHDVDETGWPISQAKIS